MKSLVVGGNFGQDKKESKIAGIIASSLYADILNGGDISDIPKNLEHDLIVWIPNIQNYEDKQYPVKSQGSVLICSKVMRQETTKIEAISRIFKMQANAVICIYNKEQEYAFELVDALGNTWYLGVDIHSLCTRIIDLYNFIKSAVRINTRKSDLTSKVIVSSKLSNFIGINRDLAKRITNSCGSRFFGNISTRCKSLFPSMRHDFFLFSPRNSNKESIMPEDMVQCYNKFDSLFYIGDNKPSIDAPIQMDIYRNKVKINYLIHGHAFIKGAVTTKNYYVCGDLREAKEVKSIIHDNPFGFMNLRNHGFLIFSRKILELQNLIDGLEFYYEREKYAD